MHRRIIGLAAAAGLMALTAGTQAQALTVEGVEPTPGGPSFLDVGAVTLSSVGLGVSGPPDAVSTTASLAASGAELVSGDFSVSDFVVLPRLELAGLFEDAADGPGLIRILFSVNDGAQQAAFGNYAMILLESPDFTSSTFESMSGFAQGATATSTGVSITVQSVQPRSEQAVIPLPGAFGLLAAAAGGLALAGRGRRRG